MIYTATVLTSCLKFLLLPAYHSTDFEVHRNWLAITYSLPLKKWYFEDTSQWTLDYPPLFAWFEYILSHIAVYFDPEMLNVENINYESDKTVLFQRLSVIFGDLIYAYGIYRVSVSQPKNWRTEVVLPVLLVTNCGLIMLDHIHFQYNGLLYGILLISLADIISGNFIAGSFWFSVLLNMKHIYIYLAPAYFVYLLRYYCMDTKSKVKTYFPSINWKKFTSLGCSVLFVFIVTFLPFYDHLGQVFTRMFPFKRGLCHAYWAPNFWAVYNIMDKVLSIIFRKFGFGENFAGVATMTGGLVQEYPHSVLWSISPLMTMVLTGVFMLPALIKLWFLNKQPVHFLRCIVLCTLTSFLFGWHVHEKAILMAIIPLSILCIMESFDAKIFLILSTVGHFSLFPLLFSKDLILIKALLLILHSTYAFHSLSKIYPLSIYQYSLPLTSPLESIYLLGLIPVFVYENFVHSLLGIEKFLPFLSLLITSVYCSIGVIYCWIRYYIHFLNKKVDYAPSKSNKKVKK